MIIMTHYKQQFRSIQNRHEDELRAIKDQHEDEHVLELQKREKLMTTVTMYEAKVQDIHNRHMNELAEARKTWDVGDEYKRKERLRSTLLPPTPTPPTPATPATPAKESMDFRVYTSTIRWLRRLLQLGLVLVLLVSVSVLVVALEPSNSSFLSGWCWWFWSF